MRTTILTLLAFSFAAACGSPYRHVPLAAPHSYTEGEEALMRGEYGEAVRHLSAYLEGGRKTYRARAHYQLARAHYYLEDYEDSLTALRNLEAEFPGFGHKQTIALQGDVAYAQGNRIDGILLWEDSYASATPAEREVLEPRIAAAMHTLTNEEASELAAALTVPKIYDLAIDRLFGPAVVIDQSAPPTLAAEVFYPGELVVSDATLLDARPVAPQELSPEQLAALQSGGAVIVADTAPVVEYPPAGTVVETYEVSPGTVVETYEVSPGTVVETYEVSPEVETYGVSPGTVVGEPSAGTDVVIAAVDPLAAVSLGNVSGPRIACLLPLTGSGRDQGRQALVALRSSFDDSTLIVRDTGSDPAEARALVQALAADESVFAVLGPILPAVISAARGEAARYGLPLQPLRARQSAGAGDAASDALARHAVNRLGMTRIGILAPDAGGTAKFSTAIESLGASIVGTHVYGSADLDVDAVLSAVQGWVDSGGVEAVYIPDDARRAAEVASAARAVAPHLTLLGDSRWNDPSALAAAGAAIDGAVIVGGATSGGGDLSSAVAAAASALQRAISLDATSRQQATEILAGLSTGSGPTNLLQVVGGSTVPVD